jgi:D-alanyl-D-alanine carboxypeptidase/D-alanyl-D-alanine-endopeptidase (penicillin-binding protein 4)
MTARPGPAVHPLIVVGAIALVPAIVLFALWRWADNAARGADPAPSTSAAAPAPAPSLSTPLFSYRRTPGVLARDLSLDDFAGAVAAFGETLNDTSCVAVEIDGVPVGATRADAPLIPASNQKLLVGAVALDVLGPRHRFTTEVRADEPVTDAIAGDLFLVGGGDPLLTSDAYPVQNDLNPVINPTSLDALADAVVAAGVQRVDGSVVGDGTRYDDEWYVPSWSADLRGIEAGPYDALLVNDARVTGDPQRAADPAEAAAREFTQLLGQRGVTVAGPPRAGTAEGADDLVARVDSAPLRTVVGEMLGTSDNNTAELLVKEIGLAAGGAGTREAGLAAIRTTLERWGIPTAGMVLDDGSGLSNENRVTCGAFADVLARSGPHQALGDGLPVAGRSGTLTDVFTDSPVTGRLRAKTGTLGNAPFNADPPAVKALSGYLPVGGGAGATIEFSLLLNGPGPLTDQSLYRPIWDALVATLASYPTGPTAAELAPK